MGQGQFLSCWGEQCCIRHLMPLNSEGTAAYWWGLSPAFFQNNVRSKQRFRWYYNIYQARYLQRDKGAKMPVWRTSAPPRDAAGQASLPSYSKCSSAPEAHWMSSLLHAENHTASWEESQAPEAMVPRWAARQEAETHWVPTGSETHSTSATMVPLHQGAQDEQHHLLWVQLKTYTPPRALAQNFCSPAIYTKHWQSQKAE